MRGVALHRPWVAGLRPAAPAHSSRRLTGIRGRVCDLALLLPQRRLRLADAHRRARLQERRGQTPALTAIQLFDSVAIRINGPKACGEKLATTRQLRR